jgi:hypothetical protein
VQVNNNNPSGSSMTANSQAFVPKNKQKNGQILEKPIETLSAAAPTSINI